MTRLDRMQLILDNCIFSHPSPESVHHLFRRLSAIAASLLARDHCSKLQKQPPEIFQCMYISDLENGCKLVSELRNMINKCNLEIGMICLETETRTGTIASPEPA